MSLSFFEIQRRWPDSPTNVHIEAFYSRSKEEQAECWADLAHRCRLRIEGELLYEARLEEEWPPSKRHQPVQRSTTGTSTRPSTLPLSSADDPLKAGPANVYFEAIAGIVVPPERLGLVPDTRPRRRAPLMPGEARPMALLVVWGWGLDHRPGGGTLAERAARTWLLRAPRQGHRGAISSPSWSPARAQRRHLSKRPRLRSSSSRARSPTASKLTRRTPTRASGGSSSYRQRRRSSSGLDDQAERWRGFEHLAHRDLWSQARDKGGSFANACIVLRDVSGARLVRAEWFLRYVRSMAPRETPATLRARMSRVGWERRGSEGRIKATAPGRSAALQWAFWIVPNGWRKDEDERSQT